MNTEAWDELIKLEEQADSILVGPSTGRPHRYVSTRQRLKSPTSEAPAELERQQTAPLAAKSTSRPLKQIQLTIFNQQGEKVKLVELAGKRHDLVAAVAKATGISVVAAGLKPFAVAAKTGPKADKRKHLKRKAHK